MISHHPSEPTLLSYAAGSMPQALAVVTAVHIGKCSDCQKLLGTLQATGGVMMQDLAPVPMANGALDLVLARLDETPKADPPVLNPQLPAPLNRTPLGSWWPIGIGMRYRPFRFAGQAWGGLILAQPGRSLPRHGHVGLELTCLLSGAFADGTAEYQAGDLSEPLTDHDQPPRVVGREPCLCVIASEGMQLRGLLGLGQRIIGK